MHKGARVRRDTKCRVGQARNLVVTTSPEVLPFFPLSSDPKRGSCFTLQDSNLQDSLLLQHEQRHETDRNLGNFWKWDVGASTECSLLQSSCSVGTASKQLQNDDAYRTKAVFSWTQNRNRRWKSSYTQLLGLNELFEAHDFEK